VHLHYNLVCYDWLKNQTFCVVVNFSRSSKVLSFKFLREYLIWICLRRVQTVLVWRHRFYCFLFFEGLNQILSLFWSLLLLDFVKIYYLFIMFSCSKRSRLNKVTKNSWFCKFIDEWVRLLTIFLCSELLKIKTISWVYSIRNSTFWIVYILEELSIVRHDFGHEL
jgi:hypothetical protein